MNEREDRLLKQLLKAKDQVEYLLERYPATRNNDFYLQIMWLKTFGKLPLPFIEWDIIAKYSGRLETVRRVRQKIQNEDGKFPPTERVRRERWEKRQAMQKVIHRI